MNPPGNGEVIEKNVRGVGDDLLDKYYVEMSEYIDTLLMELSGYTPQFYDSYQLLRSNATKIFQNFIGDVRDLMSQVRELDVNSPKMPFQGKLFEND